MLLFPQLSDNFIDITAWATVLLEYLYGFMSWNDKSLPFSDGTPNALQKSVRQK
jgi:hypothetical protein